MLNVKLSWRHDDFESEMNLQCENAEQLLDNEQTQREVDEMAVRAVIACAPDQAYITVNIRQVEVELGTNAQLLCRVYQITRIFTLPQVNHALCFWNELCLLLTSFHSSDQHQEVSNRGREREQRRN